MMKNKDNTSRKKRRYKKDLILTGDYTINYATRVKKYKNPRKDKEFCEDLTRDACFRPDIFLVNRDCDDCPLKEFCIAPIKKFSHEKRKPKRKK